MVKISSRSANVYLSFERYLNEDFVQVLSKPKVINAFWKWSDFSDTSSTRDYFRPGNPPQIDFQSDYPFGCQYDDMDPPNEPKPHWGRIIGMTWGKTWNKSGINIYSGLADLTSTIYDLRRNRRASDRTLLDMIEATIVHEMVHWSYYVTGRNEAKKYGGDAEKGTESFEREAYGQLMGLDWHLFCFEAQTIPEFLGTNTEFGSDKKLRVTSVLSYSPAYYAGIQKDDVIISMDGRKIASKADFKEVLAKKNVYMKAGGGDKLVVEISRGDAVKTLTVTFPVEPSTEARKRYGF